MLARSKSFSLATLPRDLRLKRPDLALALIMAVFGELDVLLSSDWRGPVAVNAIVVPLMALALAWRTTRPLGVLVVVLGADAFLSVAFGASQTWSSIFLTVIAVYSAAASAPSLLPVAAVAALGACIHTLRDPEVHSFGDALWASTLLGLTFLVGLAGRTHQMRRTALDEREERFDLEQTQRTAEAVAEERRRIARELHDIVSHSLSVLVVQAGAAEHVLDRDPERAREVLRSMRATGQEAIGEMGTLLGLIRGTEEAPRGPQPSLADVDRLVAKMRDAGMRVSAGIEGNSWVLPAAIELSAFRIVQEGVTNALKHAGQAQCRVVLRYREHEFEVEISDDGAGSGMGAGAGRGLAGIGERVAVFGGRFETGARPEGGWLVRAAFPRTR